MTETYLDRLGNIERSMESVLCNGNGVWTVNEEMKRRFYSSWKLTTWDDNRKYPDRIRNDEIRERAINNIEKNRNKRFEMI